MARSAAAILGGVLIASSCGSGSNSRVAVDVTVPRAGAPATSVHESQLTAPDDDTAIAIPDTTTPDTTIPGTTTPDTTTPGTTTPDATTPDATAPAVLAGGTGDSAIDVTLPAVRVGVEPGATFDEHLASMFAAFATLAADNQQWADQLSGDTFTDELADVAPDVAIDITLASAAGYIAGAQLLGAYAGAGGAANYSDESNAYFARQTEFATELAELGAGMYGLFEPTRTAPFSTQSCAMNALFGGFDTCDFDEQGQQVANDVELLFASADELDALYALDVIPVPLANGDVCDVWDLAMPGGLRPEVDLLLVQSVFDELVLYRAECLADVDALDLSNGLIDSSTTAIRSVYEDVIAVGADLGYDEEFYDLNAGMPRNDYRAGEHAAKLALFEAVRDGGLREHSAVFDPLGRAALLSFAVVGGLEVPYWQYLVDSELDDAELTQLARDCIDDNLNTLASCDPDVAPFARLAARSDDIRTLIGEPIVNWEDEISDSLDQCGIWADALATTDAATRERVAFQVAQLGLDVVLGLEDC
jgi:hypothetical protein